MHLDEESKKNFLNNIRIIKNIYKNNKDFFKMIGVDESTFSYWCNEKRQPKIKNIIKIANVIGISLEDILTKKIKAKFILETDEENNNGKIS